MAERSDLVKIGRYISILRKKKGYTQRALGELIDINDKTISKWEKGFVAPDITILKVLANVLDTTVDDLLTGGDINLESNRIINRKKKLNISIIASIILGFVIGLASIVFVQQYYRVTYREINIRDEFAIDGFIVSNKNNKYFILKNIIYQSDEIGSDLEGKINNLEIIIENENDIVFDNNYLVDYEMPINQFFNNYFINIEVDKKYDDEKFIIKISFYDNDNKMYGFKYNL